MSRPRLRVVIPGGTGSIGTVLARHFHRIGDDVTVIARSGSASAPWRTLAWDGLTLGAWAGALDGADLVINLAGRSVNCRYTPENRRIIMESRTVTTRLIGRAIEAAPQPPKIWMNASTATIYRHALDRAMDERTGEIGGDEPDVPRSWRFSIDVASAWEREFFAARVSGVRKVALRMAIVMEPDTPSTFAILSRLVRAGLGGQNGDGAQMVSWMHGDDLAGMIEFLVARLHRRHRQPQFSEPLAESRVHARAARCVGRENRTAIADVAARARRVLHGQRDGTRLEKPMGSARAVVASRLFVRLSDVARSCG